MSTQSAALRGAVKAADDDLGGWLKGLVTGDGNSPSQIIVSGILGVVPGLGQAMDLRDIVVGVTVIASSPANPMAWLDMAVTLVGCVPVVGDALKTVFRLLKRGLPLPRILDGLSPAVRGDVEKFTRNIQWGALSTSVKRTFNLNPAVGRARAGCDAACWQGATTLRAHAREEEQRRQRVAAWLARVRSAVTLVVKGLVGSDVNVHAALPAEGSGQLPDLGLTM